MLLQTSTLTLSGHPVTLHQPQTESQRGKLSLGCTQRSFAYIAGECLQRHTQDCISMPAHSLCNHLWLVGIEASL